MATAPDKAKLDAQFSDLYRAHLRDVYSYAYYRVGNHHDAEDLTEQTFLQAYRHFERAQRESAGRPLRPWLIRIAHNLAANFYRDRSRRPVTQLDDATVLVEPLGTEQLVEGREEVKEVLEGVSKLPEDRREALIMRFALDMDNREIARALGRSEGATKVLIHRAIRQLEHGLEELTELAVDELADWELGVMRDPRNWVPTAAAIVVGGAAAGGLVLVRARQQQKKRQASGLRALERSMRGVADDIEKRLRR